MLNELQNTADYLKNLINTNAKIGIVLGSGLGKLADHIDISLKLPYKDIPGFPLSTVEGHAGNLIFGKINDKEVIVMQGRFHFYEGYEMNKVVFPIRVMKLLGISHLIVSNASGGMHPEFEIGDLMLLKDHINLFPTNPLIGKNIEELGPRFPDMSEPYSMELNAKAKNIGKNLGIKLWEGVYVGVTGPCFETPSEYKHFRIIGGDAVGMSTVPEIIAAKHMGLTCFGISVITDLGVEGKICEISHEEVQEAANKSADKMTAIVKELLNDIETE